MLFSEVKRNGQAMFGTEVFTYFVFFLRLKENELGRFRFNRYSFFPIPDNQVAGLFRHRDIVNARQELVVVVVTMW